MQSLWEANMDLLDDDCQLDLNDYSWRIYSVNPNHPPQYIAPMAEVDESMINEGCVIEGEIYKTVLFQGVEVKAGSIIKESVIMPNAVIGKNVFIERAIVPSDMHIPDGTVIRDDENEGEIILVTEEMIKEIHS